MEPQWEHVTEKVVIEKEIPVRLSFTGWANKNKRGTVGIYTGNRPEDIYDRYGSHWVESLPLTPVLGKKIRVTIEVIA